MRVGTIVMAAVALAGCSGPWEVESEFAIDPPEEYQVWYAQVASCMEADGVSVRDAFHEISWYAAEDIHHREDGTRAWGLWSEPHRITIRRDQLGNREVVKHEIVHDLIQRGSHQSPYFGMCDDRSSRTAE